MKKFGVVGLAATACVFPYAAVPLETTPVEVAQTCSARVLVTRFGDSRGELVYRDVEVVPFVSMDQAFYPETTGVVVLEADEPDREVAGIADLMPSVFASHLLRSGAGCDVRHEAPDGW
jgi:hypothetical protein